MTGISNSLKFLSCLAIALLLQACTAVESSRIVESEKVESYKSTYTGPKTALVVGDFLNRSDYAQGLFSANVDQLGNQAKMILKTHLQQTNHYTLVDRDNMARIQEEAKLRGDQQKLIGARYAVSGAVTEFGRKVVGDKQFFGVLGAGKSQIAYAKVSLNIVDVLSSEVIYSVQGAGEYALSEREVMGFGSNAGYDSTLNGKVLNLAITEAVNEMVYAQDSGTLKLAE